jgi:DNA repair exonuclease SbcCD ATPase subunit
MNQIPPDSIITEGASDQAMNSALIHNDKSLPAFKSARDFPISPKPEKLPDLYSECLDALHQANQARALLRERMKAKKTAVSQIQSAIEDLEKNLAMEGEARIRLHAMNEQLIRALQDMESLAEDFEDVVKTGHQTQRTRLGSLIEKLKKYVRAWRQLKQERRDSLLQVMERKPSAGDNA